MPEIKAQFLEAVSKKTGNTYGYYQISLADLDGNLYQSEKLFPKFYPIVDGKVLTARPRMGGE